jgi:curved DNA-binding protein CbpA
MMEARLDPYAILGVARDANPAQIQGAYRRLAKRYHPDLQEASTTTEQMQRLNQAWAILSNPARRARHDADESRPAMSRDATWSGPPRRAWPRYASAAGPHHSAEAERMQAQTGRSWLTIVAVVMMAIVAIWLVIGAALFGGLPLPLIGLILFAVTRSVFRRQY